MQKCRAVLEDTHAAAQHLVVQDLRRQRCKAVIGFALEQQPHPNATLRGAAQRAAKQPAGVEVRTDQVDPGLGARNRIDIGLLDAATPAQVVAHQKHHLHRQQPGRRLGWGARQHAQACQHAARPGQRLGAASELQHLVAPVGAQRSAAPHRAGGLLHQGRRRALQLHREIESWRVRPTVVEVESVVDQVDAADETGMPIDNTQLVVQAAQLAGLQQTPPAVYRTKHRQVDASRCQPLAQRHQGVLAAKTVDHHADPDTALRSISQRLRHGLCGGILVKDIGRQPDLMPRRSDGLAHRRKQLIATGQQAHAVAAGQQRRGTVRRRGAGGRLHRVASPGAAAQASCNSTSSGRWSDIRDQLALRGTVAEMQTRPRV